MDVRLCLLGTPRLETTGSASNLPLDRPASLGYYLAVRGDWVRRSELAYLYSPEADEASALSNLRKLVHRLRQQGWAEALEADAHRLRLPLPTDMQEFRSALERRDWQAALACYRGTFLEGLAFPDLSGYEAWLELERQDLARAWRMAVHEQVRVLESQTDWPQAERWLSRLLAADPLDEEAVQALMRVLHRAGKPAQAQGVFERFRRSLKAELGVEPLEATRALADSLHNAVTAVPVETAPPKHNLPTSSTRFIGRRRELRTLAQHLANPDCRLLTLVGLGGMGKTRLALELAAQQVERFPEGVWLVALAGVASPEQLVSSIASALGFTFAGPTDPKLQLLNYLRGKELLLLLDNFEHLLEGRPLLEELLAHTSGLKMLVTSRVALELPGEWLFDLEGLPYPPPHTEDDLDGFDAVRLFIARAERLSSRFVLTPATLGATAELTRRVQGMPLALELLATWVRGLGVEEILAQLGRSFELLQTPLRDLPERHRSLEAILDYSWQLLSEAEQAVLARLSVFRGGFTLEAAQAVAGAHLGLLLRFINQSLVKRGEDGRYTMHELVRQFAAQRRGEEDLGQVHLAHAGFFARWLEALKPNLRKDPSALRQMELEQANLGAVWEYLVAQPELGLIAAAKDAMVDFFYLRGLYREGLAALQSMQAVLASLPNARALLADLYRAVGLMQQLSGQVAEAEASYHKALELAQKHALPVVEAETSRLLGSLIQQRGDLAGAARWMEQAQTLFQAQGDLRGLAYSLNALGILGYKLQGDLPQARAHLEQAIDLFETLEEPRGLATAQLNLANLMEVQGQYAEAKALYQNCLKTFDFLGFAQGIAVTQTNLGFVAWRMGQWDEALNYGQQALALKQRLNDTRGQAVSLANLGEVWFSSGNLEQAQQHWFRALRLAWEGRWWSTAMEALAGLALCFAQTNPALAASLASAIQNHPASSSESKTRTAPLCLPNENPDLEGLIAKLLQT